MIPQEYRGLSSITIRGWFWQEAIELDAQTSLDADLPKFTQPQQGKQAVLPSLDKCLQDCVEQGKRTKSIDGSIRGIIALGFSKIAKIKPLLIKLVYELDRRFPVPLPVVPQTTRELLPVSEPTFALINSMVGFGALNVTYFESIPPPLRLMDIKNRSWAILQDPEKSESIAKASAPVTSKCKPPQMKEMAEGVVGSRGGVCTTFAATAVHLLLSDQTFMQRNPRIEYVSGPKHCLVLVNRSLIKPKFVKEKIDPQVAYADQPGAKCDTIWSSDYWGDDTVIIDPWAGAMGYNVISTKTTYPKNLMSMIGSKVDKYYDSAWV